MKKRINLTAHRLRDLENRSIHHKDSLSPYNPMLIIFEFSFPQLIVVPLSCHEVDGVRKEKERLTAALAKESLSDRLSLHKIKLEIAIRKVYEKEKGK
jgi:hypothetical protein